jgi:hypothetical protein
MGLRDKESFLEVERGAESSPVDCDQARQAVVGDGRQGQGATRKGEV